MYEKCLRVILTDGMLYKHFYYFTIIKKNYFGVVSNYFTGIYLILCCSHSSTGYSLGSAANLELYTILPYVLLFTDV